MTKYITPASAQYDRGRSEAGVYVFSKTIEISSDLPFTINIFASNRYKLFVNGRYICEGPCRTCEFMRRYDTVTCNAFKKGTNTVTVQVVHLTEVWNATSFARAQKPVVIMRAVSDTDKFETDSSWTCRFVNNHLLCGSDTFLFPFEDVCGDVIYTDVPLEENVEFDFDLDMHRAPYGVANFRMLPRHIPMIAPGEKVKLSVIRKGDGFIELDAGKYVTARVKISLKAGALAKVTYAECYTFPDGKRKRSDTSGKLQGECDRISAGSQDYTFESFWYRAFRYIKIETQNTDDIISVEAAKYHYPLNQTGSFECSDNTFNTMYEISLNTLLCCTTDIFVDCPYYEQQQYIMDSAIEAAVFMRLTGDVRMVRKCICDFAASRQPSGLLCANYPCTKVQIIPGFSIFWLLLLKDYYDYTADAEFVRSMLPTADGILEYFNGALNKNGLVSRSNDWDFVDWVPGWDYGVPPVSHGADNTIYSMYYACGLDTAAYLAKECGRCGIAQEYLDRSKTLKDAINAFCYNSDNGMYHDGEGTYSAHTVIWGILSEMVKGDAAKELCKKLKLDTISKSSYSMNYYLFRALEKCGMYDTAPDYFGGWKKMIDLDCTTWCENPDDPRSECHAWSCAPLYEFSANVLGVKHSPHDEIIIVPKPLGLEWAKGNVPTRFGNVFVEWKQNAKGFSITVTSPEGIVKKLSLPDGRQLEFTDGKKTVSY